MTIHWKTPVTFIRAILRSISGRISGTPILVKPHVQQFRLRICNGCIRNVDGQCTHCDCFVDAKTWVSTESCPAGWWPSMVPSLRKALRQRFRSQRPPSS